MVAWSQQQADFIATELPLAQAQSARTGIPVSVFLTQSADETGWGTSQLFTQKNNPAGIAAYNNSTGSGFATLSDAFAQYANDLMGIGESGQKQFAADVQAHASPTTLLNDLEAGPWAAGHYGGTGLNDIYNTYNLGQFDLPGATAPAGGTPIQTTGTLTAYIPGTGIHIPGTGAGSKLLPSNPITNAAGDVLQPLIDFIQNTAIRAALVIFGGVAVLIGLYVLVRGSDQARDDGQTIVEKITAPSSSQSSSPSSSGSPNPARESVGKTPGRPPGESDAGKAAGGDVETTAEDAAVVA